MRKQPALGLQVVAAIVMGESAKTGCGDDTMTGNDQREIICTARLANRARRGLDVARNIAVSAGTPSMNGGNGIPDAALKLSAQVRQRKIKPEVGIRNKGVDLATGLFRQAALRHYRSLSWRQEHQFDQGLVRNANTHAAIWCRMHCIKMRRVLPLMTDPAFALQQFHARSIFLWEH